MNLTTILIPVSKFYYSLFSPLNQARPARMFDHGYLPMQGTISWKSGFCHRSKANITIYRKEKEDINTLCVIGRHTAFITQ